MVMDGNKMRAMPFAQFEQLTRRQDYKSVFSTQDSNLLI